MNAAGRVIHFARVSGVVAPQLDGEVGEIVARVWLGESPTAAPGAIVRTAAGWHYVAPIPAGAITPAGPAEVSAAQRLTSPQSRADLERQILRLYRGEAAEAGGPCAVAS